MNVAEQARRELDAGRPDKARALLATALRRTPADPDANNLMGVALIRMGQPNVALHYTRAAAAAAPGHQGVQINLANCLSMCEQFDEAIDVLHRAIGTHPKDRAASVALIETLVAARQYASAVAHGQHSIAAFGNGHDLGVPLASALLHVGRAREAVDVLKDVIRLSPAHPMALYRVAAAMLYAPGYTPEEIFSAHRACAAHIERHCPAPFPPPPGTHGERLRIGILSPDLRAHSVAAFVEGWAGLLDRACFEVVAFSDTFAEDGVSTRLHACFDHWRNVASLDNAALVDRLRSERLDVLVDLGGYTNARRLPTLHMRPARRVVSCIGYPATLGLAGVDARIVDEITDPPGAESWHSERLIRLKRPFLCWRPPADAPGHERRGDGIVFGSFNAVQKISDPALRAWASVLVRVPGSRLVLKASGLHEEALRDDLRERFRAQGGDPARIEFMGFTSSSRDHLAAYARIDVALDTFPYCGTTTTCESLFMGVPVVSLAGTMHHERVSLSILSSVGIADLCASSIDAYIAAAVDLANNSPRRDTLRSTLRGMLLSSPLCDVRAYARALGDALAWLLERGTPGARP